MAEHGDAAPNFALPSTDGEVRLSERLANGRVLLAFYVEDGTPTCTTELEALKDAHEAIVDAGASVIAISADGVESHRAFAERLAGLPYPLASDAGLGVARAYDALDPDDARRSRRALFVIEPEGTITFAANPFTPNSLQQLESALRAVGLEL